MKNEIKLYRVILNILFYIFYVLIISILFSFIFPAVLVLLGKDVINPNSPIFDGIQIIIIILVLIFSLILRKHFYLPIHADKTISKSEVKKVNKTETKVKEVIVKKIKEEKKEENKNKEENIAELDIKIGKEIK